MPEWPWDSFGVPGRLGVPTPAESWPGAADPRLTRDHYAIRGLIKSENGKRSKTLKSKNDIKI